jgi:YidC/Oxa1 family membrane protein insertase
VSVFDPLYDLIAKVIVALHEVTRFAGGASSGLSWAFAIVLLTVTVRLLLFPLFVKQIRAQRKMQEIQPRVKELQAKHKGDRETLNAEMMKLYKEQGANPLAGCLPLLLQAPVFFSLFTVLRDFAPKKVATAACQAAGGIPTDVANYCFKTAHGIDAATVEQAGKAKLFGAPIASAFTSNEGILSALDASAGTVRVVTLAFILFMGGTTFITQKQLMAKNGPVEGQAAQTQKILLYVMPVMLAVFGVNVALGVLLYWTTTNLWSMAQQHVVISRMGPPPTPVEAAKPLVSPKPKPGKQQPRTGAPRQSANGEGTPGELAPKPEPPPGPARARPSPAGPSRNKGKKGQRRGGRR